jgi:cobalamin biosynthetic protein CobC
MASAYSSGAEKDSLAMARDHGGNLADACARFGGAAGDWLDLSTGINPVAYPVTGVSPAAWARLPDRSAFAAAEAAARAAYGVPEGAAVVAAAGASALIGLMPRLIRGTAVAIPEPTYNEHGAAFRAAGWRVLDRPEAGTAAAVIVNPNNPDGRRWSVEELLLMAEALPLVVVDESFVDLTPEASLCPRAGDEGLVVLRSFGKFYGLAGLRLGFAVCGPETAARLRAMLGPWAVSGPALEIGARALADAAWAERSRARIRADATRLAALGRAAGWRPVGGAGLFTTFETPDAAAAQERLAKAQIWSRVFPYSATWLRLGLPGDETGWQRLAAALEG